MSPCTADRVVVTESMNRDLNKVNVWCDLWAMKRNVGKTGTMIVSRSHTVYPRLTTLTLDGTVMMESANLVIFGVSFDAKMTFENHLCSVSGAVAQRLGIMRKSWQAFHQYMILIE